jgi:hypothetical protein
VATLVAMNWIYPAKVARLFVALENNLLIESAQVVKRHRCSQVAALAGEIKTSGA